MIYRGGEPRDFELKVRVPDEHHQQRHAVSQRPGARHAATTGKWVLKGYQADIDIDNQFTGQIYEERGRGFLALRGRRSTSRRRGHERE